MNKWAKFPIVLSAAMLLCLLLPAPASVAKSKIIISDAQWPPFFFEEDPSLDGIGKEIINLCAPVAGYEPVYRLFPIRRMYVVIENGKIDATIFSLKEERKRTIHYSSQPLFESSYRPFVRADSEIIINELADFDGLRLAHLNGLRYSREFREYLENRTEGYITVNSNGSLINMLSAGRADIFVDTVATVFWEAKTLGKTAEIKLLDFNIQTKPYFLAVSRQSKNIVDIPVFLREFDNCVAALKHSGRYAGILLKYGTKVKELHVKTDPPT